MYPRVSGGNEPQRPADERAQARGLARPSGAAHAVLPGVAIATPSPAAGAVKAADVETANGGRPAGQARAFGVGVAARRGLEPGGQGGGCGGHVRFLETAALPYAQIRHTDIEHIKNKRKGRSDRRWIEERKPPQEGSSPGTAGAAPAEALAKAGPRLHPPERKRRRTLEGETNPGARACQPLDKTRVYGIMYGITVLCTGVRMGSERFEMRIDSDLLDRLDHWRKGEDDMPSRAESVRRLIEAGLAHDNKGRAPLLSDGEKLVAIMLCELIKKLDIDVDTNIDLVQKVIYGGHYWALGWEMPGIFHGHVDKQSRVRFVTEVLDMWQFLEEAFEKLTKDERKRLAKEAEPFGRQVEFPGFDGNNEGEYLGIAAFLINDLERFSRFRRRHRELNSHHPTLEWYGRMLRVFEPIRKTLAGRRLSLEQLVSILNSGKSS